AGEDGGGKGITEGGRRDDVSVTVVERGRERCGALLRLEALTRLHFQHKRPTEETRACRDPLARRNRRGSRATVGVGAKALDHTCIKWGSLPALQPDDSPRCGG